MPFSLLRYPGGKFYALKEILPEIEKIKHEEYREPFFGGGTVFFNKVKSSNNWINDKYGELIFFLKFIKSKENLRLLIKQIENEDIPTKERHAEIKDLKPNNSAEKAFKFFYLNRTSFSGKMTNPSWGYRPIRSVPPSEWHKKLLDASEKLKGIKISNLDFSEVIRSPSDKEVLMYLDPPYFKANQKSHYLEYFKYYDHLRLKNELENTNYKFLLSYDDSDEIRSLYKNFKIIDFDLTYRIENSNPNDNKRKKVKEILITNVSQKQMSFFQKEDKEKDLILEKIRSPIRYPGSKLQAVKRINKNIILDNYDEYWEPFFGGGALFFAKPLAKKNFINDSNKDLINFFKGIQNKETRIQLIKKVSSFEPTKENFDSIKNLETSSNFEAACRFFIINRTCYSGIMNKPNWGYHEKKSLPPRKWGDRIMIAGEKLEHAQILNKDFRKFFKRKVKNNVFAFIDPPYFKADQKRAYSDSFLENDHLDLLNILKEARFNFLLTYDDCPEIRELYSDFDIKNEEWMYHTANSNVTTRKVGKELFIKNF